MSLHLGTLQGSEKTAPCIASKLNDVALSHSSQSKASLLVRLHPWPCRCKGKTRRRPLRRFHFHRESLRQLQPVRSFFRHPKRIEKIENVLDCVDTFYNLVTNIYEWGRGQSFHFSPSIPCKVDRESTCFHGEMVVDLIKVSPNQKNLDAGCSVGSPMWVIAAHSRAKVVGITINKYQVNRAKMHRGEKEARVYCVKCLGYRKQNAGPALRAKPPSRRLGPPVFGPIIGPQILRYVKYYICE